MIASSKTQCYGVGMSSKTKLTVEEVDTIFQQIDDLPEVNAKSIISRWPRMLQSLVDVIDARLDREGCNRAKLPEKLVFDIANYLGGLQLYIPRNEKLITAIRNYRIYQEFDGTNITELAEQYQTSTITIYDIIRQQNEIRKAGVKKDDAR